MDDGFAAPENGERFTHLIVTPITPFTLGVSLKSRMIYPSNGRTHPVAGAMKEALIEIESCAMKNHFKNEALLMVGIPLALLALGILAAILLPKLVH